MNFEDIIEGILFIINLQYDLVITKILINPTDNKPEKG
jgi:hypothetical protein